MIQIKTLLSLVDRMSETANSYRADLEQRLDDSRSHVSYERYGLNGFGMHRGYYCPSVIADIVVGNRNRGRIIRNKPEGKSYFAFGFDENDVLVFVEGVEAYDLLTYEGPRVLGVEVRKDTLGVHGVSECCYHDGRLQSYVRCVYDREGQPRELTFEQYRYSDGQMLVEYGYMMDVTMLRNSLIGKAMLKQGLPVPEKWLIRRKDYSFVVENGVLVSYQVHKYDDDGNENTEEWVRGHTFVISKNKQRRV